MTDQLRVGVVGVGHLGQRHAKAFAALSAADLVGVYDLNQAKAERVAQECGATAFTDLDSLLDTVHAVSVVVPTVAHYETAATALDHGLHVFVEKPLATTLSQADGLIQRAADRRLILQVGHIERFNPAVRALRGTELQPLFIESHRLSPFDPRGTDVAVVLDLMIHDIDLILSLVNSPIQRIDANGVAVLSAQVDIANARIQFENGCVANVTASRISQKKMRKMRLFQANAYIALDFLRGVSEIFRLVDRTDLHDTPPMPAGSIAAEERRLRIAFERPSPPPGDPLELELHSFLQAIARGERPVVSGEDGRRALEVALEINDKIRQQTIQAR